MQLSEQEFLKAIELHKGILYKVSRMYFDKPEDQQDLVQEIILQLWKSLNSFEGKSEFSSWMYRVALNTAIVFFKKEKRKQDNFTIIKNEPIDNEVYDSEKDQQLVHFYKAVNQLTKIEKAIIILLIDGYSGKKIAENLLQKIIKTQGYEF
jgi:RNA polymerase sigma-70 factor (ECF subfamily)